MMDKERGMGDMPIGILANAFSIFIGGLLGMKLGLKFS